MNVQHAYINQKKKVKTAKNETVIMLMVIVDIV